MPCSYEDKNQRQSTFSHVSIFMAKKKRNSKKRSGGKRSKEEEQEKRKGKKKRKKGDPLDHIKIPDIDVDPETKKSIFIVLLLGFGLLCFLSLVGAAGTAGEYLQRGLELAFGWGKWLTPILLILWGIFLYKEAKNFFRGANYLGLFLFVVSIHPLLHFFYNQEEAGEAVQAGDGGGYVGMQLAELFKDVLGFWGGLLILFCLFLISILLTFNTSLRKVVGRESIVGKFFFPFHLISDKLFSGKEEEEEEDEEEEEKEESEAPKEEPASAPAAQADNYRGEVESGFSFQKKGIEETKKEEEEDKESQEDEEEGFETAVKDIKIDLPLDLLDNRVGKPVSGNTRKNSLVIQRTLENFGIPVEMGESSVGPTITRYTFKPAEGIKLSRVTALSNDLALALAAHPIRIEAPIPGRALVGIEVPNKAKAIISLREILSSKEYNKEKGHLKVALGRDVTGKTWNYDITKMPHLLIAGATNSGKSVCINSLVVSLLYHNNPSDLRFIMVDPKRVELPIYNDIPHLLTPVITDVNKTVNALKWCLNEMDRRFEVLSQSRKRDIHSYNESVSSQEKMPHIVFIVDELADLMIAAAKEIEASVIRLTQMARAVGIHIILATQRPSVDVITGLIKANVPARIAFSVASGVDSKTILDTTGAEKLIGQGDMLFTTAEFSRPKRIQGVFIGDNEIKRVINYIKERSGDFEYVNEVTEAQKVNGVGSSGMGDQGGSEDEMFEQAKEMVIKSGKASASFLQRRLSVGYARAARLIDELEEEGIVGPANGSKPREILVSKEEYEAGQEAKEEYTPSSPPQEDKAEEVASDEPSYPVPEEEPSEEYEDPGEINTDLAQEEEPAEEYTGEDVEEDTEEAGGQEQEEEYPSSVEKEEESEEQEENPEEEEDDDDGMYFAK